MLCLIGYSNNFEFNLNFFRCFLSVIFSSCDTYIGATISMYAALHKIQSSGWLLKFVLKSASFSSVFSWPFLQKISIHFLTSIKMLPHKKLGKASKKLLLRCIQIKIRWAFFVIIYTFTLNANDIHLLV